MNMLFRNGATEESKGKASAPAFPCAFCRYLAANSSCVAGSWESCTKHCDLGNYPLLFMMAVPGPTFPLSYCLPPALPAVFQQIDGLSQGCSTTTSEAFTTVASTL